MSLVTSGEVAGKSPESSGMRADRRTRRAMPEWQRKYHRAGLWYVLPAVALFLLMIAYPILRSLYLSFFDYSILEPDSARFVGFGNYSKLFTQQQNLGPAMNTLKFTILFVPPYVLGSMIAAMMLNAVHRGKVFLRTMIFAPIVVSLSVSSVMFSLFYSPSFGMAQRMLEGMCSAINHPADFALTLLPAFAAVFLIAVVCGVRRGGLLAVLSVTIGFLLSGLGWTFASESLLHATQSAMAQVNLITPSLSIAAPPVGGMLGQRNWAMIAIVIVCLWGGVGFNIILFLVGLQRIPDELYEAGMIDGAGAWKSMIHITLPQLRPMLYLVLLLSLIGAFKIFGQPYIMTQGGPEESTLTYVMRLYNLAFKYGKFELGYASALAYAMAMFILVFSLILRRLNKPVE